MKAWPLRLQRSLLLALALVLLSAPLAFAQERFPQQNKWHRVTPSVVWCGDPDSTVTIEVHITGRSDVAAVEVMYHEENPIPLYDDGTHGDVNAGDNVFTAADVLIDCNPDHPINKVVNSRYGDMVVTLKNGRQLVNTYGIGVGMVNPRYKNQFEVMDFGGGLSATAYAFFIEDSSHEVFDDYPVAHIYCGKSNFEAFLKLYSVMPDEFDFVLLMPGMQMLLPESHAENVPYDVLVSNSVENIGLPIMDDSGQFGSAGRLKSMIYHSFGSLAIFDHEVAHTWGASYGDSLGLIQESGVSQGHWNKLSDIAGQLAAYYFDENGNVGHFKDNGDGTWRLISNIEVEPYAPLELYLMGLIPPEEVPPIHILTDPDLRDPERISAASVRTITIEQLMAAEGGSRVPGATESQKAFNLAFTVAQGTPFNDAAYAFFSLLSYSLMSADPPEPYSSAAPFFWATGGRATLNTRLPIDLPEPSRLPGQPTPTVAPASSVTDIPPTLPPTSSPITTNPTEIVVEETEPTPETRDGFRFGNCPIIIIAFAPGIWAAILQARRRREQR
ncbi:MAG: hypothetical protein GTO14_16565 [Anaerolineales bacterium]|nr:hypothetical protein [Anaerolineales bacterium]